MIIVSVRHVTASVLIYSTHQVSVSSSLCHFHQAPLYRRASGSFILSTSSPIPVTVSRTRLSKSLKDLFAVVPAWFKPIIFHLIVNCRVLRIVLVVRNVWGNKGKKTIDSNWEHLVHCTYQLIVHIQATAVPFGDKNTQYWWNLILDSALGVSPAARKFRNPGMNHHFINPSIHAYFSLGRSLGPIGQCILTYFWALCIKGLWPRKYQLQWHLEKEKQKHWTSVPRIAPE